MHKFFSCCFWLSVLFCLLCPSTSWADNHVQLIKDSINEVKDDSAFIWAERTNPSREMALQQANHELVWSINQSRISCQLDTLSSDFILSCSQQLSHLRGSQYRVFVYAPYALSLPAEDLGDLGMFGNDSIATELDSVYVDYSLDDEEFLDEDYQDTELRNGMVDVISLLFTTSMVDDAQLVLKQLVDEHKISSYGQVRKMSDTTGDVFLLVFDRADHSVLALIEGRDGSFRNLKTNEVIDLKRDYPGCGALWFK